MLHCRKDARFCGQACLHGNIRSLCREILLPRVETSFYVANFFIFRLEIHILNLRIHISNLRICILSLKMNLLAV